MPPVLARGRVSARPWACVPFLCLFLQKICPGTGEMAPSETLQKPNCQSVCAIFLFSDNAFEPLPVQVLTILSCMHFSHLCVHTLLRAHGCPRACARPKNVCARPCAHPKSTPIGSKSSPRGSKIIPRGPPEASRAPQEHSKSTLRDPRARQEVPRASPPESCTHLGLRSVCGAVFFGPFSAPLGILDHY